MSIGLTKATNGYFVPTSAGVSLDSSRAINPDNIVCYNWDGTDTTGRPSTMPNSPIRTSGCNSALDDINLENSARPNYFAIINGGGVGIKGDFNTGLNQVAGTTQLPASNPMSIPQIQVPSETVSKEGFSGFDFTLPTKRIGGNSIRTAENYNQLPEGNFGNAISNIIRKSAPERFENAYVLGAKKEKFENSTNSYVLGAKEKYDNSYVLGAKEKYQTSNSYVLGAKENYETSNSYVLGTQQNDKFINSYQASAEQSGHYPGEKFQHPPLAHAIFIENFGQTLAPPKEKFSIMKCFTGENYPSKLDDAKMSDKMKSRFAGVY